MKPRIGTSLLIFISSYSPLALILLIRDLRPVDAWYRAWPAHPVTAFLLIGVAVASVWLLLVAMRAIRHGSAVVIASVSNQSGELVNYSIPYMISFFGFGLGDLKEVAAFAVFLALMFVLTVRTQNIFINPILALRGYGLYDVEYGEGGESRQATFLSKLELKREQAYRVRRINRFLYVVTEEDPTV